MRRISTNSSRERWLLLILIPIVLAVGMKNWAMLLVGLIPALMIFGLHYILMSTPEVYLGDDGLTVRANGCDQVIPYASITGVRETRWSRPKTITVEYRGENSLKILTFIPTVPINVPFFEHHVVTMLRERAVVKPKR